MGRTEEGRVNPAPRPLEAKEKASSSSSCHT